MSSFENFVQCRVVTPFTAAATEIGLFAADEPHRLPAEGGGVLVLTDSPYRPSVLEVIRYGWRSGLALYEVSRAQEGTTARDWTGVAFCYQALTAGELERLLGQKADVSSLEGLREEAETALGGKVDKVTGKGLSTHDYTTTEKDKLANANLTALVSLSGDADRLPYFTDAGALSLTTLTEFARVLLDDSDAAEMRSTLGLLSASQRNVVTTNTDTTLGRLLQVGAFGIGSTGIDTLQPPTIFDFATGNPAGLYRGVANEVANGPTGTSGIAQGFTCTCMAYSSDRLYIVTFPLEGTFVGWYQASMGAVAWDKLYGRKSILGTVGQSGGVPTGAIIERGSNANGQYVKFADGTLICHQYSSGGATSTAQYGADSFRTASIPWTYPHQFISEPVVSGNGRDNAATGWLGASHPQSGSVMAGCTIVYFTPTVSITSRILNIIAVGRWY